MNELGFGITARQDVSNFRYLHKNEYTRKILTQRLSVKSLYVTHHVITLFNTIFVHVY